MHVHDCVDFSRLSKITLSAFRNSKQTHERYLSIYLKLMTSTTSKLSIPVQQNTTQTRRQKLEEWRRLRKLKMQKGASRSKSHTSQRNQENMDPNIAKKTVTSAVLHSRKLTLQMKEKPVNSRDVPRTGGIKRKHVEIITQDTSSRIAKMMRFTSLNRTCQTDERGREEHKSHSECKGHVQEDSAIPDKETPNDEYSPLALSSPVETTQYPIHVISTSSYGRDNCLETDNDLDQYLMDEETDRLSEVHSRILAASELDIITQRIPEDTILGQQFQDRPERTEEYRVTVKTDGDYYRWCDGEDFHSSFAALDSSRHAAEPIPSVGIVTSPNHVLLSEKKFSGNDDVLGPNLHDLLQRIASLEAQLQTVQQERDRYKLKYEQIRTENARQSAGSTRQGMSSVSSAVSKLSALRPQNQELIQSSLQQPYNELEYQEMAVGVALNLEQIHHSSSGAIEGTKDHPPRKKRKREYQTSSPFLELNFSGISSVSTISAASERGMSEEDEEFCRQELAFLQSIADSSLCFKYHASSNKPS